MQNVEKILVSIRKLKPDLTRSAIARLLEVNESTIHRWEHGKATPSKAELSFLSMLELVLLRSQADTALEQDLNGLLLAGSCGAPGVKWMRKYGLMIGHGGFGLVLGYLLGKSISEESLKPTVREGKYNDKIARV